jgi:hypothetical protein
MRRVKTVSMMAAVFGLTLGAVISVAGAQQSGDQGGNHGSGMMGNRGGSMMGMMNGVDAAEMNRMMQNCNRMMEGMMQMMPNTPPMHGPERRG